VQSKIDPPLSSISPTRVRSWRGIERSLAPSIDRSPSNLRVICIRPITIIDVPLDCLIDVGAARLARPAGWRVSKRKFLESRGEGKRAKTTWRLQIEARQLGQAVQDCLNAGAMLIRLGQRAKRKTAGTTFLFSAKPVYAIAVV